MPQSLVQACVTMVPRLEAEEQVARVNATGLAMGDPQSDDVRAERDRLHAHAQLLPVQTSAQRPKPAPDALAAAGFAVRRVPVRRRRKKATV